MDLHTVITNPFFIIAAVLLGVFVVVPTIVAAFLRDVEAGTIRIVSWITGGKGCRSKFRTGTWPASWD